MSDDTPRLGLPYLASAQAQKHVTVNETLNRLDGLVACCVLSRALAAPPAAPAEGDAYLAPGAELGGAWAGAAAGDLLRWIDGAWTRQSVPVGLLALVVDEARLYVRDASDWRPLIGGEQQFVRLGVGVAADGAHPFAVKANAAMFTARDQADGGDGDLRMTFNKEATSDVLSLLFQTAFAARAEIGLVGDDRLKLRVSADGSSFTDAVTIEPDGRVGVGAPAPEGVRMAVGGVPPISGAVSVVGAVGGVSLAVSDNVNSSLYVCNAQGGAIIGTDGGGVLHLAADGCAPAHRGLSLDPFPALDQSSVLVWIDTGSGRTARRIGVGPPDSAGAGYRQLRVPN